MKKWAPLLFAAVILQAALPASAQIELFPSDAVETRRFYQVGEISPETSEVALFGGAAPGLSSYYDLTMKQALEKHWGAELPPTLHAAIVKRLQSMRAKGAGDIFLAPGENHVFLMEGSLDKGARVRAVLRHADANDAHAVRSFGVTRNAVTLWHAALNGEFAENINHQHAFRGLAFFFDNAASWAEQMAEESAVVKAGGKDPSAGWRLSPETQTSGRKLEMPEPRSPRVIPMPDEPPPQLARRVFTYLIQAYREMALEDDIPQIFRVLAGGHSNGAPESKGTWLKRYLQYIVATWNAYPLVTYSQALNAVIGELAARVRLEEDNPSVDSEGDPFRILSWNREARAGFTAALAFLHVPLHFEQTDVLSHDRLGPDFRNQRWLWDQAQNLNLELADQLIERIDPLLRSASRSRGINNYLNFSALPRETRIQMMRLFLTALSIPAVQKLEDEGSRLLAADFVARRWHVENYTDSPSIPDSLYRYINEDSPEAKVAHATLAALKQFASDGPGERAPQRMRELFFPEDLPHVTVSWLDARMEYLTEEKVDETFEDIQAALHYAYRKRDLGAPDFNWFHVHSRRPLRDHIIPNWQHRGLEYFARLRFFLSRPELAEYNDSDRLLVADSLARYASVFFQDKYWGERALQMPGILSVEDLFDAFGKTIAGIKQDWEARYAPTRENWERERAGLREAYARLGLRAPKPPLMDIAFNTKDLNNWPRAARYLSIMSEMEIQFIPDEDQRRVVAEFAEFALRERIDLLQPRMREPAEERIIRSPLLLNALNAVLDRYREAPMSSGTP